MVSQIAPSNAPDINAEKFKVPEVSFKAFEQTGDHLINSANNNFKLFANIAYKQQSADAYRQFSTDPVQLANALSNIQNNILPDAMPEDLKQAFITQMTIDNIGLVQKAKDNQEVLIDQQNKENAAALAQDNADRAEELYKAVLQNHHATAENKNDIAPISYQNLLLQQRGIAELKDRKGKYVYSEAQRKKLTQMGDVQTVAFKNYFDEMILNDDDKLTEATNYYQKFILAPERFMEENFMDRKTYDAAKAYAQKALRQAGIDIKGMKFNQSVKDALALQVENLPERLQNLKESGIISNNLIKQIEKTNVKFDSVDPAKIESPFAMLNALDIIAQFDAQPTAKTDEAQIAVLQNSWNAQAALADYANTYGLSDKNIKTTRSAIAIKTANQMYGDEIDRMSTCKQSFGSCIPNMNKRLNQYREQSIAGRTIENIFSPTEQRKLGEFNDLLQQHMINIDAAVRSGDVKAYSQEQYDFAKNAARIKYSDVISPAKWTEWEKNPDTILQTNGKFYKIKNIDTENFDLVIEEIY